jgi:hypothetical protein
VRGRYYTSWAHAMHPSQPVPAEGETSAEGDTAGRGQHRKASPSRQASTQAHKHPNMQSTQAIAIKPPPDRCCDHSTCFLPIVPVSTISQHCTAVALMIRGTRPPSNSRPRPASLDLSCAFHRSTQLGCEDSWGCVLIRSWGTRC